MPTKTGKNHIFCITAITLLCAALIIVTAYGVFERNRKKEAFINQVYHSLLFSSRHLDNALANPEKADVYLSLTAFELTRADRDMRTYTHYVNTALYYHPIHSFDTIAQTLSHAPSTRGGVFVDGSVSENGWAYVTALNDELKNLVDGLGTSNDELERENPRLTVKQLNDIFSAWFHNWFDLTKHIPLI